MKRKGEVFKVKVTAEDIENGVRGHAHMCPIAESLRRTGYIDPAVSSDFMYLTRNGVRYSGDLPAKARKFVGDFDNKLDQFVKPFEFTIRMERS